MKKSNKLKMNVCNLKKKFVCNRWKVIFKNNKLKKLRNKHKIYRINLMNLKI